MISCSRCLLTSNDDPKLIVDAHGICNYCTTYAADFPKIVKTGEAGKKEWQHWVETIKKNRKKNSKYDCILGTSGGIDSTYLAYLAKQADLKVLCVHLDNGWNSKEAVSNIKNIITKLGFDLYTQVLDWEEFKDLQISYFKAGVLDLDVPTDHAMLACLYNQAIKHKVKYILGGYNFVTESVLPSNFNFDKGDATNLLNIHRKFGTRLLKTFPLFRQREKYLVTRYYRLVSVRPLNWLDYHKEHAKRTITEKLGWKDYGQKHYENIFTRFYQGYILPRRFGIDKRKAHLSNLICSGQLTREEALLELEKPLYDPAQLEIDMKFVLNKFGWTEKEFEEYMTMPKVDHAFYGVEKPWSHYLGFNLFRKKK